MPKPPIGMALIDLLDQYDALPSSPTFERLYDSSDDFAHMFSVLHLTLNQHFEAVNGRAESKRHYWADNSREMISLIKDLNKIRHEFKRDGLEVKLDDRYQAAIERCEPWLSKSGGSTVPDGFEPIEIIKYEPVFTRPATTVKLKAQKTPVKLKQVGEGSYANVFSYVDPDYGIRFAVKRAKRTIGVRDLERFKQEFKVMKELSFPYIVEVYRYDEERNEYRMEFCDETLRKYISKRNIDLTFSPRKRIALQFLYGINYIHSKKKLHRDISLQNVLLKVYESGAVLVKLSDFGLVKEHDSEFTQTQTEMRGTIRDPLLRSFKDYSVLNEVYSIGWVLSYIFTGRESLWSDGDEIGRIVHKCASHDAGQRYQNVLEIIGDVEKLNMAPTDAPA